MFKALILVRNLKSNAERLDFGEFVIWPIRFRFKDLRETFASTDVNQDDWLFEKSYTELPSGPPGAPVGGIPRDLEDNLLLLRLYKRGDVSFVRQVIIPPGGSAIVQFPYRIINDLNSYSQLRFEIGEQECRTWGQFATKIRQAQSWGSDWLPRLGDFSFQAERSRLTPNGKM